MNVLADALQEVYSVDLPPQKDESLVSSRAHWYVELMGEIKEEGIGARDEVSGS